MSLESQKQISALREKGGQALSDMKLLLENGSIEGATNRGYYAVFQAARPAPLTEAEGPKTHSGVIQQFNSYDSTSILSVRNA